MQRDYNIICEPYGEMAMGAGLDIVGGVVNNLMAKWREDEARAANYKYNEMAAQNADARTRTLYNDLQSPQALLQQYQAAGLSPSLMFGGGGVGGQTTNGAQGEGASGISPTTYGINPVEAANLALIEAQTRKTNAEAATEEGTNERGKAEIASYTEQAKLFATEAGLNTAKTALTNTENAIKTVEQLIAETTYNHKIGEIMANAEKASTESKIAWNEFQQSEIKLEVTQAQKEDLLKIAKLTYEDFLQELLLKGQKVKTERWNTTKVKEECWNIFRQSMHIAWEEGYKDKMYITDMIFKYEDLSVEYEKLGVALEGLDVQQTGQILQAVSQLTGAAIRAYAIGTFGKALPSYPKNTTGTY